LVRSMRLGVADVLRIAAGDAEDLSSGRSAVGAGVEGPLTGRTVVIDMGPFAVILSTLGRWSADLAAVGDVVLRPVGVPSDIDQVIVAATGDAAEFRHHARELDGATVFGGAIHASGTDCGRHMECAGRRGCRRIREG